MALRARELLRKIELGILPDSSPEIVGLVMRYDEGSPQIRHGVIGQLKRLKAWRQLLKIHAMERDERTLSLIDGAMQGVALAAAAMRWRRSHPIPGWRFPTLRWPRPVRGNSWRRR